MTLTVTGTVHNFFTVLGQIGQTITGLLLNQDGTALLTESGDVILY